jgi:prolyl-tRNA editing enzyme YbaK/EbsC (Cys-tRNA(Pro) deacylase)
MNIGKLNFIALKDTIGLVADTTKSATTNIEDDIFVSEIDPDLADTSTFCKSYDISLDVSVNCVVIEAKKTAKTWYVACMISAVDKIDINGKVRRLLGARKASFAPMDKVLSITKMEYGGITPVGLPKDWQIFVDQAITVKEYVIIGSGVRHSKLLVPGAIFAKLPNSKVENIAKKDII